MRFVHIENLEPAPPILTNIQSQEEAEVVTQQDTVGEQLEADIGALGSAIHRRNVAVRGVAILGTVGALSIAGLLQYLNSGLQTDLTLYKMLGGVITLCATTAGALAFVGIDRIRHAAERLSGIEGPQAIGVMTEALNSGDLVNGIAASYLIKHLPEMRTEDASLLSPEQHACLRKSLIHATTRWRFNQYNPALAGAILQALVHIGDESDLDALTQLASRRYGSFDLLEISKAASSCCTAILTRQYSATGTTAQKEIKSILTPVEETQDNITSQSVSSRLSASVKLRKRNLVLTLTGAVGGTVFAWLRMRSFAAGHFSDPFNTTGLCASTVLLVLSTTRGLYQQRNLTHALMHSRDLNVVGSLVEAAATNEISGTTAAIALVPLLHRVAASDEILLTAEQRVCLQKALSIHYRNTSFALVALRVLQKLGDVSAIPAVERTANRSITKGQSGLVQAAASDCLAALRVRAAESVAQQSLLRPSSITNAPDAHLLRPADGSHQTQAEELVRAVNPE